jgi:hypothetical protein
MNTIPSSMRPSMYAEWLRIDCCSRSGAGESQAGPGRKNATEAVMGSPRRSGRVKSGIAANRCCNRVRVLRTYPGCLSNT